MADSIRDKIKPHLDEINRRRAGVSPDSLQAPPVMEVHVIIAEAQAEAAEKLERQTEQLIFFTKVLVGLTVALFLLTAYLSYDAYLKNKAIDQAQHSSTK